MRHVSEKLLAGAPEWAREAIAAILLADWASLPLAELAGGEATAAALEAEGLAATWRGLAEGDRVTLTAWGAERLGVEIDEEGRVCNLIEEPGEVAIPYRPTIRRKLAEECRWYGPDDARPPRRMPKVRGFVPLPFADRVAMPARDEEPAAPIAAVARLVLLGMVAAPLKPRSRSKKKGSKARRRAG
jgi:hypothetical protein